MENIMHTRIGDFSIKRDYLFFFYHFVLRMLTKVLKAILKIVHSSYL